MSWAGANLLPAIAGVLKGWRGTVRALDPQKLGRMLELGGSPDEAKYVTKMKDGPDFRGMIQQALNFSREGDQQDWEREEQNMDPVRNSIHRFVTEHVDERVDPTTKDPPEPDPEKLERVTMQRKAMNPAAKAARRKEKLARKGERGQEKLRAKKYRKSAGGKRAVKRRGIARKKLGASALKKKGVIRHYQPQHSGLADASFGKLVHELKSIALVRP
jgi:hypothetical protein